MTRRTSPTAKARRVAGTLREMRERAGMSAADAARGVDHDASWISRIERVENRPHPNDVRALLTLYGNLSTEAIDAVVAVARQARQRGWWYRYSDVMPDWFGHYIGLETDAAMIRTFEAQVVPGLLQTADYARATILSTAAPDPVDRVEQRVCLRIERQALLDADDPPHLRVVLDEAALRRPIGGPKVMGAQIEHLVVMAARPNIQIQVLPTAAGIHAGMDGSFVLLDFSPPPAHYPGAAEDRLVYIDTLLSAIYLEEPGEVAAYAAVFEQLRAEALPPEDSCHLMRTIAADMSS
ncbi:MAG TPA: helix-turn-helix transcriptional regulator [Mycobacteriales bacterium]